MTTPRAIRTILSPFLLLLALASCGTPQYYLLPAPGPAPSGPAPSGGVSVADVSLPAYAEAIEMASLGPDGAVTLDKRALWADTPRRGLTRQLIAALQERLAAPVAAEPWPGFDGPSARVEVIVDRLIGGEDGSLQFTGQYVISAPATGRIIGVQRFAIEVPPQGPGYLALANAYGRAIDALADRIVASLTGRRVVG